MNELVQYNTVNVALIINVTRMFNQNIIRRRPRCRAFIVFYPLILISPLPSPLLSPFLSLYLPLWYITHSNPTIKKIRSWWGFLFSPYQESSDQSNTHQSIKSPNTPKKRRPASNIKAFFSYKNMSMSSMSSPSSAVFSPEHLSPSEHLCYVRCNFCETILAVICNLPSILSHFLLSSS